MRRRMVAVLGLIPALWDWCLWQRRRRRPTADRHRAPYWRPMPAHPGCQITVTNDEDITAAGKTTPKGAFSKTVSTAAAGCGRCRCQVVPVHRRTRPEDPARRCQPAATRPSPRATSMFSTVGRRWCCSPPSPGTSPDEG